MKKLTSIILVVLTCATATVSACELNSAGKTDSGSYVAATSENSTSDPYVYEPSTVRLTSGYVGANVKTEALNEAYRAAFNSFTANVFKELYNGDNALISPLSIELALAMTANGAKGETLGEMENTLFGGGSINNFNANFKWYLDSVASQKDVVFSVADSIWFKDDEYFTVEDKFLQTNADYYSAEAYKAPFNDATLKDINGWVKSATSGMIDSILDKIDKDAVTYLINALYFDADWAEQFEQEASLGVFTTENGKNRNEYFMFGSENVIYENDYAEGFAKKYKGGRFAYLSMLPKEGVTMREMISSLDGEALTKYFASGKKAAVRYKMPKIKLDYSTDLVETLKKLGITTAFDGYYADFSGLGGYKGGNLYISIVKHKTAIEVTETGTKASAVTAVGVNKATSVMPPEEVRYVYLDRPFVYFILDTKTDTPVFMGAFN